MFRSSENAAMDQAIDMCKEMDDELDDCFRTLQRLNAKYNPNDCLFVSHLGMWDENEDGDKRSSADTDDMATDDVSEGSKSVSLNSSKVDLEGFDRSKGKSSDDDSSSIAESKPIADARTYSALDKTYKDLSVKCIKLRRDLETSSRQLMHILEMADRAKDATQIAPKH